MQKPVSLHEWLIISLTHNSAHTHTLAHMHVPSLCFSHRNTYNQELRKRRSVCSLAVLGGVKVGLNPSIVQGDDSIWQWLRASFDFSPSLHHWKLVNLTRLKIKSQRKIMLHPTVVWMVNITANNAFNMHFVRDTTQKLTYFLSSYTSTDPGADLIRNVVTAMQANSSLKIKWLTLLRYTRCVLQRRCAQS